MPSPKERRELRRIRRELVKAQYKVKPPRPQKETKDNMGNVHVVMTLALFVGLFLLVNYASETVISVWGITKIVVGIFAVSLLVPIKWYRKKFTMSVYEFFLINLLGYAPLFSGLFFFTNHIGSNNFHIETYKIKSIEMGRYFSSMQLENDTLSEYAILTAFDSRDSTYYKGRSTARYEFMDGLWGLKVILDKRAIP
jgi:hypothetical protein